MMLLGDICMLSDVFFVEYFLSLLVGPSVLRPELYCTVWSIRTNTLRWDVSYIPMHSWWRSLITPQ